jgi:predicted CoA-binding protein
MTHKKTLVLGASENPERYSNKAIRSLSQHGMDVVAVGLRKGKVGETEIQTGQPAFSEIDSVTLYLSAKNQIPLYDYILSLKPRRIIYNPGAENAELEKLAEAKGVENLEACTLVLLATNQY